MAASVAGVMSSRMPVHANSARRGCPRPSVTSAKQLAMSLRGVKRIGSG